MESNQPDVAQQVIYDYRQAPLSAEDRALCDFAAKLTLEPHGMSKEDFDRLTKTGFSEEQITVAVQVIGYFNYINRVAEGLGVDPETWMTPPREEWLARKHHWRPG